MAVRIASELHRQLLAHAAALPEAEVCGLLFGTEDRIIQTRAAANVSTTPSDSFELDPEALFAALRAERAGGARLLGHYHSHPFGPPDPSPRDAAAAGEAGRLWLILGERRARLWRARRDGPVLGAFEPVRLRVDTPIG